MGICQLVKDAAVVPDEMRALENSDFSTKTRYRALLRFELVKPHTTLVYDIESCQETPVNHYVYTRKGSAISVLLEKIGYA